MDENKVQEQQEQTTQRQIEVPYQNPDMTLKKVEQLEVLDI